MEGGWRRRVAWIAGVLLGLVVLALLLPPLILRGPVLRWAVRRGTASLCGEFALGSGRLGWMVVPDLLLGRPFTLELDDARVRTPDGREIIGVEHLRARVTIERHPWRITIDDAVATRGGWRLTDGGPPGTSFVDAFRTVPTGGPRSACRERQVKTLRQRTLSGGDTLTVRDAQLEEIDTELDFRDWGLKLPRVRARGSLAVGVPASGGILFDAHDVAAPGGALRVGRAGSRGLTRAPFDDVAITRVAATSEEPTDIVLTVKGARTGRSILSGTARFENVFKVPYRLRRSPGMQMEARWTDTAEVLARLEAGWLPPGATLEEVGLGGVLVARLDGPFKALSGTVSAEGRHAHLDAKLEDGRRGAADVRADGLDLAPILDPRLHSLLAGRASGRLRAHVELPSGTAKIEATIDEADLAIDRAGGGPGPRRFSLHVGTPAPGARRIPRVSTADTLALDLDRARLRAGTLDIDGLHARWAGLSLGGRLALSLPAPPPPDPPGDPPADPSAPHIDATISATLTSLERWVAPTTVAARGTATVRVGGALDHLRARVTFGPSSHVTILGERFSAPPAATAALDGRLMTVTDLRFAHEGGGEVAARVRGELGGKMGGHLEISGYPVSRVPTFAAIKPPYVLGAPEGASLADVLEGTLDARLDATGTFERPAAAGTASLTGVRVAGRPVPDGRFTVRLAPLHATVAGTLGPTLSVEGEGGWGHRGVAATASTVFNDFAIAPWLPRPLDKLVSLVTGPSRISVEPGRAAHGTGTLRVTGPAGELQVDGALTGTSIQGAVNGRVEVAGLRPVWSPALASADGALDVDVRGKFDYDRPTLDQLAGTIVIARPLRAKPVGSALELEVASGGRIALDGPRLSMDGLAVTTAGARAQVSGNVRLDLEAPARSTVALSAAGELDAGALARRASIPMLAAASGEATFAVRAEGEAAAPTFSGQARFVDVELRPAEAGWPAVRIDGTIEASGHTVRTRDLRVETPPTGTLTIGGPNTPASVEILSLDPARLGRVDVPVSARGLHIGGASSSLEIGALDLGLRLTGDTRALELRGDIGVARARFDPSKGKPSAPKGPSKPWYESLPPHLLLDLTLHGPADALSVAVPVLPDVRVGFACHVSASRKGATLSGQLRGSTVYSRMALAVYDWIKPQDVRACRVLKEQ